MLRTLSNSFLLLFISIIHFRLKVAAAAREWQPHNGSKANNCQFSVETWYSWCDTEWQGNRKTYLHRNHSPDNSFNVNANSTMLNLFFTVLMLALLCWGNFCLISAELVAGNSKHSIGRRNDVVWLGCCALRWIVLHSSLPEQFFTTLQLNFCAWRFLWNTIAFVRFSM